VSECAIDDVSIIVYY